MTNNAINFAIGGPYTIHLEEASSTVTYVGYADPDTATSASTWSIKT